MIRLYILDEKGNPAPARDMLHWSRWFDGADRERTVMLERVREGCEVSTVFLGINHNHSGKGPPVLWETMVFGGVMDEAMNRCAGSREQAEAMHADMVERVSAVEALNA